jgi:hypothetical protein
MIWNFTCSTKDCKNNTNSVNLVNPTNPVLCSICHKFTDAIETDQQATEPDTQD